jgi:hypothetical protein
MACTQTACGGRDGLPKMRYVAGLAALAALYPAE